MARPHPAVAQVLNAVGWTYVAAFVTSLPFFLSYLLPLLGAEAETKVKVSTIQTTL
jgi:hypothetical protein